MILRPAARAPSTYSSALPPTVSVKVQSPVTGARKLPLHRLEKSVSKYRASRLSRDGSSPSRPPKLSALTVCV